MTIEKRGIFLEKIDVKRRDLILSTDTFARSVELTGDCGGDSFGWRFEDNYFDLTPGMETRIHIYGKHEQGIIRITFYYWEDGVEISWK